MRKQLPNTPTSDSSLKINHGRKILQQKLIILNLGFRHEKDFCLFENRRNAPTSYENHEKMIF